MARLLHRPVFWAALILGTVALFWWLRPSQTPAPSRQPEVEVPPSPVARTRVVPPPSRVARPPVVTSPSQLQSLAAPSVAAPSPPIQSPPAPPVAVSPDYYEAIRQRPEQQEAEEIALNLRHFGQRFGGNPTGTNAEIVKALNGGNSKGVRYLDPQRLRLNDQGELIDSWGTPYFFHQLSAQQTEIRSAGPDRTLWTQDDILSK